MGSICQPPAVRQIRRRRRGHRLQGGAASQCAAVFAAPAAPRAQIKPFTRAWLSPESIASPDPAALAVARRQSPNASTAIFMVWPRRGAGANRGRLDGGARAAGRQVERGHRAPSNSKPADCEWSAGGADGLKAATDPTCGRGARAEPTARRQPLATRMCATHRCSLTGRLTHVTGGRPKIINQRWTDGRMIGSDGRWACRKGTGTRGRSGSGEHAGGKIAPKKVERKHWTNKTGGPVGWAGDRAPQRQLAEGWTGNWLGVRRQGRRQESTRKNSSSLLCMHALGLQGEGA